jgi:hypothetical protein
MLSRYPPSEGEMFRGAKPVGEKRNLTLAIPKACAQIRRLLNFRGKNSLAASHPQYSPVFSERTGK